MKTLGLYMGLGLYKKNEKNRIMGLGLFSKIPIGQGFGLFADLWLPMIHDALSMTMLLTRSRISITISSTVLLFIYVVIMILLT